MIIRLESRLCSKSLAPFEAARSIRRGSPPVMPTVDEARESAKQLMQEHQRVIRVMIVESATTKFVEWMDRS